MEWMLSLRSVCDGPMTDPGLPRPLLRHVLCSRTIGVGSRVLVVGCGSGALLRFLDELCLEPFGLDESEENVDRARKTAPHLVYACGSPAAGTPFPEQHFNLIIVREVAVYRGDLAASGALLSTAGLLAGLYPGGRLAIVSRHDRAVEGHWEGHPLDCYTRHLENFPGNTRVISAAEPWSVRAGWRWFTGGAPRAAFAAATLDVPAAPAPAIDWQACVAVALARASGPCCNQAAAAGDQSGPRRSAA